MMKKEFISKSINETYKIASIILNELSNGDVVLLKGDLGAGKTNFVKGIVNALNGNENIVTSPTFTIVNEYNVENKTIYHFDLYRINSVDELYNIGIEEYLYSDAICFIEWPERAEELFNNNCKKIEIFKISETERKITFNY